MPLEHCEHVYRNMKANPCPICNKETHEIDFAMIATLHKEHIAQGKDAAYICNDCGGTIRGWWDI